MIPENRLLRWRREKFLKAIDASDLWAMQRRVTGAASKTVIQARWAIMDDWPAYITELRHWTDYTLTGEHTL